jgi:hypothetical protein
MRLLRLQEGGALSLVEFKGSAIPPYAILSHTWGPDNEEVTFQDVTLYASHGKVGYRKLYFCGEQAKKDSLDYFWVDTCCIRNVAQARKPCESAGFRRQRRRALDF